MRNDRRQGVRGSGGRLGTRQKGLDDRLSTMVRRGWGRGSISKNRPRTDRISVSISARVYKPIHPRCARFGPPDIFSRSRVVDKLKGSPVVASRFALPPIIITRDENPFPSLTCFHPSITKLRERAINASFMQYSMEY